MKKIIITFLIVSVLFVSLDVNSVKASDTVTQNVVDFSNGVMNGYSKLLRYAGMIIDTGIEVNRQSISFIKEQLIKLGLLSSGASDQDVEDFFNDNIIVSPHSQSHHNNIEYTPSMVTFIKNEQTEIINQYGFYYVYSYDILQNTSSFPSGDVYNAVKTFCENYQNDYMIFYHKGSGSIVKCPLNSYGVVQESGSSGTNIYANQYNLSTWGSFNYSSDKWTYNSTSKVFEKTGTWGYNHRSYFSTFDNQTTTFNGVFTITYNGCHIYKMYRTLNDLKSDSVGQSPYYISDSYNTFRNISGSYNTNTIDNSVTYGDITNYINSFNTENGSNPSQEEIQIYINVTNESGTGSGGGNGSGSGDDSGSGGDSSSIWDFLSRLGEVLGGLISNLGNMLTSLIDSIISIINDVVGKIPDIFTGLLNLVFGGLPEDLRAIIILGITVMVVYGIIKVIRG